MKTELDNIKSTITISLGTKNRLRKLKGSQSYEDYINFLIRIRNQSKNNLDNTIELQNFQRRKGMLNWDDGFAIMFSYNSYNNSQNFVFDISINIIRQDGKKINILNLIEELSIKNGWSLLETEYRLYFNLLQEAIKQGIDSMFHHKGRIEDYYQWNEEFKMLNLSKKSFDEDVMEKLRDLESGVGVFT